MLCDIDKKECEFLKAEQELVGNQLKSESISASKEQLAVSKTDTKESPLHWKSKYLPSRAVCIALRKKHALAHNKI